MLRAFPQEQFQYNQKPRKLIKINREDNDDFNQFKGQIMDLRQQYSIPIMKASLSQDFKNFKDQNLRDKNIFTAIKQSGIKFRKITDASQTTQQVKVKLQEREDKQFRSKVKRGQSKQLKIKHKEQDQAGKSNWERFLSSNKASTSASSNKRKTTFVAMDCEFVKSNEEQLLARVSIISEQNKTLLDTYVKPSKNITDYATEVSGITYAFIKNAPSAEEALEQIKKVLYNKILVGHTVWKDLEVCKLTNWKGFKAIVDISQFEEYKQKSGKLISLKNLSMKYLRRQIQSSRHSSVEDAQATMQLFNLKKKDMLKQFKVIY